ncbi:cytochrome c oxidase subunit 4 [Brachybacterium nesterenkovii]|uniref:Cytochrome c oxidase polypeptide 4 n=1 Tax=Brachybacterium nesterenkovii TaxID=47847 RepID=A0A1X6WVL1_9MICO|nr:cytochrome c oxidase subunit 4 [Brachybacterium nesterenkovii]SLM89370.1 putative integral membrane protein [Brachybacterium nesterenkovii]
MRTTARIFTILMVFFLIVGTVYGLMSSLWDPAGLEPVGFAAILMLGGLSAMIAAVMGMNARRHRDRPEDDMHAPVSADAGIQGSFAPYSWWPLWCALAGAMVFLGVAAGWWIAGLGAVVAIYGVTGWVMEFSRGPYAH